ncbi:tetratricopeptide repeat protein [Thiolapillus sp.]|uniref:tetratricopeptide repeat protein n=1 Tax=Thiolapillus sp. TaxID=2017437 RepID=UPI003AF58A51
MALGIVYQVKNDSAAAEQIYLQGIDKAADKVSLRRELAHLYLKQQRYQEAEAQFKEVLKQKGLSLDHTLNANFALCRIGLRNKAYDDVIKRAKRLIALYPPLPHGYQFLASAYLAKGKVDAAISVFESLVEANRQSPVPYQELAIIAMDRKQAYKQALNYAREGAKRFPDDARTQDVLGWVYYQQGDYESASSQFQIATRQAPDNARFFYHLGLALQKLGKKEQARATYRRAIGLINQAESEAFAEELKLRIKNLED